MKIALLSPIAWRTPPRQYGPWEQVVSYLAEELVALGIDVTLFATGDSVTTGKLAYCINKPYAEEPGTDAKVSECLHISNLMERAGEFDLIHNHYDFLPITYSRLIKTRMITTIHGFSSPSIVPVYKKYDEHCHYVSISNSDRHPSLHYAATVYNGININHFTFHQVAKDYLLFFGRIHPEKGTSDAIHIAKRCKKRIIIAGLIQDKFYFENKVKPYINNDDIIFAGNCGPERRNELLGNALALLHPVHFDEPFGLSVVEAMCCGTPVIAYRRGSMPEIIKQEKTGFLVDTMEEATEAVQGIYRIERQDCRYWAASNFSAKKMADEYLEVYKRTLQI